MTVAEQKRQRKLSMGRAKNPQAAKQHLTATNKPSKTPRPKRV